MKYVRARVLELEQQRQQDRGASSDEPAPEEVYQALIDQQDINQELERELAYSQTIIARLQEENTALKDEHSTLKDRNIQLQKQLVHHYDVDGGAASDEHGGGHGHTTQQL